MFLASCFCNLVKCILLVVFLIWVFDIFGFDLVLDGVLVTRGFAFLFWRLMGFFWRFSFGVIKRVKGWLVHAHDLCFLVGLNSKAKFLRGICTNLITFAVLLVC